MTHTQLHPHYHIAEECSRFGFFKIFLDLHLYNRIPEFKQMSSTHPHKILN